MVSTSVFNNCSYQQGLWSTRHLYLFAFIFSPFFSSQVILVRVCEHNTTKLDTGYISSIQEHNLQLLDTGDSEIKLTEVDIYHRENRSAVTQLPSNAPAAAIYLQQPNYMVMVRDSWSRSIDSSNSWQQQGSNSNRRCSRSCSICGITDVHLQQSKIFHGKESALSIGRNSVAAWAPASQHHASRRSSTSTSIARHISASNGSVSRHQCSKEQSGSTALSSV